MKLVFRGEGEEVKVLSNKSDTFRTEDHACGIEYQFDKADRSLKLTIDGDWFWEKDLDAAIAFLQAAKVEISQA